MGAYASLALGPDAFNLLGARTGAGRLAPILTDWLTTGNEEGKEDLYLYSTCISDICLCTLYKKIAEDFYI